jgi:Na+-transporting NADH:ubiquinone oxidoreductase subunit A
MSRTYRIRKGVDIRLKGEAEKRYESPAPSNIFAVKPPDFHGLVPKLEVKQGDEIKAGTALFHDKYNAEVKYCSPVSGEVAEVVRGAKRRILEVKIIADQEISYKDFGSFNADSASRDDLLNRMLEGGMWPFVEQRPFAVVANPKVAPKAIFISGFDSSPLAPDPDFVMEGQEADFAAGLKAMVKLADGKPVHLNVTKGSSFFKAADGVTVNEFSGPHPAGNVGVQIHKIDPINKGDVVWVVKPQDVSNIGRFLSTGNHDVRRNVALTGSEANNTAYFSVRLGYPIASLVDGRMAEGDVRIVSGNPLSGSSVAKDGFLGYRDHQITLLPEGHDPQFFLTKGWLGPGFDKFSLSRTFPTWMIPGKKYTLNTNQNGEERAFVMSGEYEKVFPFDIYPVHLLKAIIVNDVDAMEKLGIYEVAPEDFALCEYGCTSKIEAQKIIREGLDTILEEFS